MSDASPCYGKRTDGKVGCAFHGRRNGGHRDAITMKPNGGAPPAVPPFQRTSDSARAICYLTDTQGYYDNHEAWLYDKPSLHSTNRRFIMIGRRLKLLESHTTGVDHRDAILCMEEDKQAASHNLFFSVLGRGEKEVHRAIGIAFLPTRSNRRAI